MQRLTVLAPFVSLVVGSILLGGCGTGSAPFEENRSDFEVAEWMLPSDPEFIVTGGVVDGDSVFFNRAYRGVITGNGDAAIVGDHRIIYLNSEGEVVAHVGRMGSGPGEFRSVALQVYHLGDDRLAIWDGSNRRFSLFTDRQLAEDYAFDLPFNHSVIGMYADEIVATTTNLAAYTQAAFQAAIGEPFAEVISPGDSRSYRLRSLNGKEFGTFTEGMHVMELPTLTRRQEWGDMTVTISAPSCWPWRGHVVVGEKIVIADGQTGVVSSHHRDGTRVEATHHSPRSEVTQGMIDSLNEVFGQWERMGQGYITEESKRETLSQFGQVGDPLPSLWDAIVADASGPIWLRRASCFPPDDEPRVWDVIGGDGLPLSSISVPPNLRVLAVKENRLLGVLIDSLGVERVALFLIDHASNGISSGISTN